MNELALALDRLSAARTASADLQAEIGQRHQLTLIDDTLRSFESMLQTASDVLSADQERIERAAPYPPTSLTEDETAEIRDALRNDIAAEEGDALRTDVQAESFATDDTIGRVVLDENGTPIAVSDEENERRAADVDTTDSEGRLADAAGVIKSTPRRRR